MPFPLQLQAGGKRQGRRSVVALSVGDASRLLFIRDTISGRKFLCDTGAQRSVIPASEVDIMSGERGPQLAAADGSPIRSYGVRAVELCFGGQRFVWDFVMAAIAFPLLGADFLCDHAPRHCSGGRPPPVESGGGQCFSAPLHGAVAEGVHRDGNILLSVHSPSRPHHAAVVRGP